MSAFSSSATVSAPSSSSHSTFPDNPIRWSRQEHHHHFSHKGSLRCTRTFQLPWPRASAYLLQVQHVVPEVTIPPEVTPENVTTYIVDSGGRCLPLHPIRFSISTKPAHRIDSILNQKFGKPMSYAWYTPSTTQTPSTVYLHFGSLTSAN